MGFQGMKRLNRIQSIVFDAAYNTNENLLISAPTGAGKTNIAMLTILREIKQNIEEGVIKKDKFKVGFYLRFIYGFIDGVGEIFTSVSKIFRICFGFLSLHFVVGKNLAPIS